MASSSSSAEEHTTSGLSGLSLKDVWIAAQYFLFSAWGSPVDAAAGDSRCVRLLIHRAMDAWDSWDGPAVIPMPGPCSPWNESEMLMVVGRLTAHARDQVAWLVEEGVDPVPELQVVFEALLADCMLELERRMGQEGKWSFGALSMNDEQPPPPSPGEDKPTKQKRVKPLSLTYFFLFDQSGLKPGFDRENVSSEFKNTARGGLGYRSKRGGKKCNRW
jgi:hypothetical protein